MIRSSLRILLNWTFFGALAFVIQLATLSKSSAQDLPGCTYRFDFNFNSPGPWPIIGKVKSGQTCIGGRTWWSRAELKHLYLASPPKNGSIRFERPGRWFYTSKRGFVGNEVFSLKICANLDNKPVCTFLEVRLEVTAP